MAIEVYLIMTTLLKTVSLLVILFLGPKMALAELLSSIETQGLSFISENYENTRSSNFGFFGASIKSIRSDEDVFKINLKGMYAMGTPVLSYLNLREMYFTIQIDATSQIHIGRKINLWSNVDDRWNLGFFQPQFRWNSLSPENQGLTGFFWQKKISKLDFLFYGSPIYIPDQGPSYELKSGEFESNNPWFQSPPQTILFQNESFPIDYNIQTPNTSDIVFQSSFGMQLKYNSDSGLFTNLSAIYKPSHQMAYGYKGVLVTDRVSVTVVPKTYYENVVAADIGYAGDWGGIDLSALYLRPRTPVFDNASNYPVISESTTFGPHLKLRASDNFIFDLNVLMTSGEDIFEVGPDASPNRQSLSTKFTYRNAYEVSMTYKDIFMRKFRLTSLLSWRQAQLNNIRILRSQNTIDLKGPWKFIFDLILVQTSDDLTSITSYRNLDQLWIGASYDF
jgi:hypothetical protein